MSSLKLAICLAGQPRFYRDAHRRSYDAVYKDRDVDIFLHAWHHKGLEGGHYTASSGHGGGPIEENLEANLLEFFQPKKSMILPQPAFNMEGYHVDGTRTPHLLGNFAWSYSLGLVGHLLRSQEAEQGWEYDRVLVMRYDLDIRARLPIEDIDPGTMHTLDTGLGLSYALTDQLFLSGSQTMQPIFDLYKHMHRYFQMKAQFNTERNSHDIMVETGTPMSLLHGDYCIIRG